MVWYGMVWYGMVWYGMVWYDYLILGGDLNIDIECNNAQSKHIEDICSRHEMKFGWQSVNANPEPTFHDIMILIV